MEARSAVSIFYVSLCVLLPVIVSGDCDLDIGKMSQCPTGRDPMSNGVEAVHFNGTCNKENKAQLVMGETYELSITFTPEEDAMNPVLNVAVIVFSMKIPLPSQDKIDVCTGHGLKCPLKADQKYTFVDVFTITDSYAISGPMDVEVIWALDDDSSEELSFKNASDTSNNDNANKHVFCFKAPVVVTKKKPTHDFSLMRLFKLEKTPSFTVVH